MMMCKNIRDYGAAANKEQLATLAIQQAIDDCSHEGGGTVFCPPGTYLIGTLIIKDNVTLYLEHGALLLGSGNRQDYRTAPDGKDYLIYAENSSNIRLSGPGTIDGNAIAFFTEEAKKEESKQIHRKLYVWDIRDPQHYQPPKWRPRAMVHFLFCRNVTVEDVTLLNSPFFTLWPLACDDVRIHGIKIFCYPVAPNADGIDIDCCKDTIISDCRIKTDDDAIAIKSDSGRIGVNRDCENLVVSNCILSSICSGIRLGYEGDGAIRNCSFNNIVITDTWLGIDFLVVYNDNTKDNAADDVFIKHGARIENIHFSNMRIESVRPIHMWVGDESQITGGIRNVKFSNITFACESEIGVYGARNNPIRDISFQNIEVDYHGKREKMPEEVPYPTSCWGHDRNQYGLPYGVFCRHADNLDFNEIKLRWDHAANLWQNPMKFDHVKNTSIRNLDIRANNKPPVDLVESTNIDIG